MCVRVYVCMYVCMYVCAYTHTYIYIYIHTHTVVPRPPSLAMVSRFDHPPSRPRNKAAPDRAFGGRGGGGRAHSAQPYSSLLFSGTQAPDIPHCTLPEVRSVGKVAEEQLVHLVTGFRWSCDQPDFAGGFSESCLTNTEWPRLAVRVQELQERARLVVNQKCLPESALRLSPWIQHSLQESDQNPIILPS